MRFDQRLGWSALTLAVVALGAAAGDDEPTADHLAMTRAVACEAIHGFDDYVPLDEAAVTKDEKLLVYYEPQNFKVERDKQGYHVHLSQDARVRRRGEKAVLWKKEDMAVYEARSRRAPGPICMTNRIALKALRPGEYDLDIILHDRLADAEATQVLKFRVKPSPVEGATKDGPKKDDDRPKPDEPGPRRDCAARPMRKALAASAVVFGLLAASGFEQVRDAIASGEGRPRDPSDRAAFVVGMSLVPSACGLVAAALAVAAILRRGNRRGK